MYDLYEVRPHGNGWSIVHIRSGYKVETRIRYRRYADELCRRYNTCL